MKKFGNQFRGRKIFAFFIKKKIIIIFVYCIKIMAFDCLFNFFWYKSNLFFFQIIMS